MTCVTDQVPVPRAPIARVRYAAFVMVPPAWLSTITGVSNQGETVECLASEEFLGNLPFEFDAVGTVPGHGFHPLKARQSRSIPNLQDVHHQGRTPRHCLKVTEADVPRSKSAVLMRHAVLAFLR
jgi:hypothetical protein